MALIARTFGSQVVSPSSVFKELPAHNQGCRDMLRLEIYKKL